MDLGIFTDEIIKNIDSAVTGSSTFATNSLWVDPETGIDYFLAVQFPEQLASNLTQLGNIPIKGV